MSKTTIWARLKAKGFSDFAVAAIMGNMQAESAFRSNNVEDRSGIPDEQYTAQVDNGSYTRDQFVRDSYGYGLCQWTYSTRKAGLYDFARRRGDSIADEQMQIDWLLNELINDYSAVYSVLHSDASLYDMTSEYMKKFENPFDQSYGAINTRYAMAQDIYNEFAGTIPDESGQDDDDQSGEPDEDTPTTPFWPPRMLCSGMVGSDVGVLQWLLIANGYTIGDEYGVFGIYTNNSLIAYQSEHGLATDGIAGPRTFSSMGVRV